MISCSKGEHGVGEKQVLEHAVNDGRMQGRQHICSQTYSDNGAQVSHHIVVMGFLQAAEDLETQAGHQVCDMHPSP